MLAIDPEWTGQVCMLFLHHLCYIQVHKGASSRTVDICEEPLKSDLNMKKVVKRKVEGRIQRKSSHKTVSVLKLRAHCDYKISFGWRQVSAKLENSIGANH